ncbi:hypothetical protein ACQ7DA_07555 [Zafaria sp. J156]|uniref:hypothetical protein n=1 Tax=Zafaria sp. J156 TaxID=3116490 RepID=UPI002E793D32|nr:hypothetical protein [Zafaria sp. J156]MEE1620771.1 hypothetical protein [Zafaria sp. J156]
MFGPGPQEPRRIGRRPVLAALGAGFAASLLRAPAAWASRGAPVHGRDVPLERLPDAVGGPLRRVDGAVRELSPVRARYYTDERGGTRLALGCIGLDRQLQILDPSTGRNLRTVERVTDAQQGVQDFARLPDGGGFLVLSGHGLHVVDENGEVTHHGDYAEGVEDGYEPRAAADGSVWAGSYGPGGHARFLRIDPRDLSVEYLPPIDDATDYVRSVSIAGGTVWGGIGSREPALVSMTLDAPGRYTIHALPEPATGNVQRVQAWEDVVAVSYRRRDGSNATALLDPETGRYTQLDSNAWRFDVMREGRMLYYFDGRSLVEVEIATRRERRLMDHAWTGCDLLAAEMHPGDGGARILAVGRHRGTGRYVHAELAPVNGVITEASWLEVHPSAMKVQTVFAARDGSVVAGGYQATTLGLYNADLGGRRSVRGPVGHVQPESMVDGPGGVLLASYPGAALSVLDTDAGTATALAAYERTHGHSRPFGMTRVDGLLAIGSVPSQGRQGGGLLLVGPTGGDVRRSVEGLVGGQSIVGLAAHEGVLYVTSTVRAAYGAPDAEGPAQVLAYDVGSGRALWRTPLPGEGEVTSPIRIGAYLYCSLANGIVRLRADDGRPSGTFRLYATRNARGYRSTRIAWHAPSRQLVHAGGGDLVAVGIDAGTRRLLASGGYSYPAVGGGRLYAVHGETDVVEIAVPSTK